MKRQHPTDANLFWCPKCKTYKARGEFHENKSPCHGGLHAACKNCRKEESRARRVKYKNILRKKDSEYQKSHYIEHLAICKKHYTKSINELGDWYVKNAIRQTVVGKNMSITPELIELKRQQIIMKRTLKQLKEWRKEHESDRDVISGE